MLGSMRDSDDISRSNNYTMIYLRIKSIENR